MNRISTLWQHILSSTSDLRGPPWRDRRPNLPHTLQRPDERQRRRRQGRARGRAPHGRPRCAAALHTRHLLPACRRWRRHRRAGIKAAAAVYLNSFLARIRTAYDTTVDSQAPSSRAPPTARSVQSGRLRVAESVDCRLKKGSRVADGLAHGPKRTPRRGLQTFRRCGTTL